MSDIPASTDPLQFAQLEALYDELAEAIDQVGPERESVFLAKLVLSMAQSFGHAGHISTLIRQCRDEPPPDTADGTRIV